MEKGLKLIVKNISFSENKGMQRRVWDEETRRHFFFIFIPVLVILLVSSISKVLFNFIKIQTILHSERSPYSLISEITFEAVSGKKEEWEKIQKELIDTLPIIYTKVADAEEVFIRNVLKNVGVLEGIYKKKGYTEKLGVLRNLFASSSLVYIARNIYNNLYTLDLLPDETKERRIWLIDKITNKLSSSHNRVVALSSTSLTQRVLSVVRGELQNTSEVLMDVVSDILLLSLVPSYKFSRELNDRLRAEVMREISGLKERKRIGEVIVEPGEEITPTVKLTLETYFTKWMERLLMVSIYTIFTLITIIFFVVLLVKRPLSLYNENRRKVLLVNFSILGFLSVVSNYLKYFLNEPATFLSSGFPMFIILSGIFLGLQESLLLGLITALAFIPTELANIPALIILVMESFVLGYVSSELYRRDQFFTLFLAILGIYTFGLISLWLENPYIYSSWWEVLKFSIIGVLSATANVLAVMIITPYIENRFRIASSFKLYELSNISTSVLKEFSQKAPGSFQHCLQVSVLAEKAAVAIGANALLAKVGALYHDIGKLKNPEYFIENSSDGEPVPNVSPFNYVLIIKNHVKYGIELARKYNLPVDIEDFIKKHHGTSLIKYFYFEAKKIEKNVAIEDFKYPGPKPDTKETAIVMLADSIEAAYRSIEVEKKDITPKDVEELVKYIFEEKIIDGQLEKAPLTLEELEIIRRELVDTIVKGFLHKR